MNGICQGYDVDKKSCGPKYLGHINCHVAPGHASAHSLCTRSPLIPLPVGCDQLLSFQMSASALGPVWNSYFFHTISAVQTMLAETCTSSRAPSALTSQRRKQRPTRSAHLHALCTCRTCLGAMPRNASHPRHRSKK